MLIITERRKTVKQYLEVLGEPTSISTSSDFVWWELFKIPGEEHIYGVYIPGRMISIGFYIIRSPNGITIEHSHFQTSEATPLSLEDVLNLNPPEDVRNKLLFNLDLFA